MNFSDPSTGAEILQAEAELRRHEDFLTLHEGISRLQLKYQEVIVLRFFEDKQLKEIGEILGKREGTVKSLLHRGLEKLRKLTE
jgi:RNA polymerase sigma-70 factor (ECF subfamily)